MSRIPVATPNGCMDLVGTGTGQWLSLRDMMDIQGKTQPENTNSVRMYANTDLLFCYAPDAVAANPSITPMKLAQGNTMDLFEAEQIRNLRIKDVSAFIGVQFYRS